jgi:hypothetical protein
LPGIGSCRIFTANEECELHGSSTNSLETAPEAILTAELKEADAITECAADEKPVGPHRWTQDEAREAARLSREIRAKRREREPPSDAEIERGLRERAVTSARDAEVLLRWRQTVRPPDGPPGVDLDSMSERELERSYAGLLKLAALPDKELRAVIASLLAEAEHD